MTGIGYSLKTLSLIISGNNMKNKKTLYILLIALAVTAAVYFISIKKKKEIVATLFPLVATGGGDAENGPVISSGPVRSGFPLYQGAQGRAVKILQLIVGVKPDGVWGPKTEAAMQLRMNDTNISMPEFVNLVTPREATKIFPLKQGDNNRYIGFLQSIYNLTIDGKFGAKTAAALGGKTVSLAEYNTVMDQFINAV